MPFEAEPPEGDYAAYIDRLVNQGGRTPGMQKMLRRNRTDKFGTAVTLPPSLPSAAADPSQPAAQTPPQNLAQQSAQAKQSLIKLALGAFFGLLALGSAFSAIFGDEPFEGGAIVRTLILLFAARMLFVQGRRDLKSARVEPAALPPFQPAARPKAPARSASERP